MYRPIKKLRISVEGLELPNKPLSNIGLINAVRKLEIPEFRGVFVRDNLPVKGKRNECGILNLDDASGRGNHRVVWYRKNYENYYFDSYGIQPPREIIEYLKDLILYFIQQSVFNLKEKCSAVTNVYTF